MAATTAAVAPTGRTAWARNLAAPIRSFLAAETGGAVVLAAAAVAADTALALGILALVAPQGATRLRVFLLTLVVIDDLIGLVVIAVVYTDHVSLGALAVALALFGALVTLRWAGPWRGPAAAVA